MTHPFGLVGSSLQRSNPGWPQSGLSLPLCLISLRLHGRIQLLLAKFRLGFNEVVVLPDIAWKPEESR